MRGSSFSLLNRTTQPVHTIAEVSERRYNPFLLNPGVKPDQDQNNENSLNTSAFESNFEIHDSYASGESNKLHAVEESPRTLQNFKSRSPSVPEFRAESNVLRNLAPPQKPGSPVFSSDSSADEEEEEEEKEEGEKNNALERTVYASQEIVSFLR